MKTSLIFILFAIIIIGCNSNHKTSDLLGTWDCVSSTDIKTGEILLPKDGDRLIVEFRPDSLKIPGISVDSHFITKEVYGWEIKGDTISIEGPNWLSSLIIKELTPSSLTVEIDFVGEQRLTFRKIK